MNAKKNAIIRARVCVYIADSTFYPTLPTLPTPNGVGVVSVGSVGSVGSFFLSLLYTRTRAEDDATPKSGRCRKMLCIDTGIVEEKTM